MIGSLLREKWDPSLAQKELYYRQPLPALYEVQPKPDLPPSLLGRMVKLTKQVVSTVIFPLFIYQQCCQSGYDLGHRLLGRLLFSSSLKNRNQILLIAENWNSDALGIQNSLFSLSLFSTLSQVQPSERGWFLERLFKLLGKRDITQENKWQFQRFTVQTAEREKIDAFYISRKKQKKRFFQKAAENLHQRVILYSCSQDELAEGKIHDQDLLNLAEKTQADIVLWNYLGIGSSSGKLNRESMVKAYDAMLSFVEDSKGLGAKEIIGYSYSVGSAIQLEALKTHALQADIRYVFVLRSAFSTAQSFFSSSICSVAGAFIKRFGWDWDNIDSLSSLKAPALILHRGMTRPYQLLRDSGDLMPDGVIEDTDVALAKSLLDRPLHPHRKVVSITGEHNARLTPKEIGGLATDLNRFLKK